MRFGAGVVAIFALLGVSAKGPAATPIPHFGAAVTEVTLPEGENDVRTVVLDPADGFGYFGVGPIGADPGGMVKIRLGDLAWVGVYPLATGDLRSSVLYISPGNARDYAVFGTGSGTVVGAGTDFYSQRTVPLAPGETFLYSAAIEPEAGVAYFGTSTAPGNVVKVQLSDFTRVGALPLGPGENFIRSAVIDTAAGFAYFGTATGVVVKVRLSDFTRVGALTLGPGEVNLNAAAIDPAAGFAYFGASTSPGRVIKVRLSDFTRVTALTLNAGEDLLASAVLDPVAGYAAFGTLTSPGKIVRVRLSDLTHAGTTTLAPGRNNLQSGAFDTASGLAYFGTDGSPGVIVRLDISDRVGTTTAVTSSKNPSITGDPVTFTASVSPVSGPGTPTGTIQFMVAGSPWGAPIPLVDGMASTTIVPCWCSVGAIYGGDGAFSPSTGALPGGQVVQAPSVTTVTASPNPSRVGQEVLVTGSVNCYGSYVTCYPGYPVGSVQLRVDGVEVGDPLPLNIFSAKVSLSSLPAGTHVIEMAYLSAGRWASSTGSLEQVVVGTPPMGLHTLTPCRAADTREPDGTFGGPALQPEEDRAFPLAGVCGIPPEAVALSLNVTVTAPTGDGFLTVHAADIERPLASTLNFQPGQTRANQAVTMVKGDGSGTIKIYNGGAAPGTVHVIVDVNGYFQ